MPSKNKKNNNNIYENIKIILLGNSAVGKTAIINKFDQGVFNPNSTSTYSPNFIEKKIKIDNKMVTLSVWDTAGQEKFHSVSKLFIKNAKIVILVYDITCKESFDGLKFWYDFLKNELAQEVVIGLAGNKIDLIEEEEFKEEVSDELAEQCANDWGAEFALLSAKLDKKGIDDFFEKLVRKYLDGNYVSSNRNTISISDNSDINFEEKKGCC